MALDMEQELALSVGAMSLGQMAVRTTDKGQPCYFYRLKKFNLEDIHPTLFGTGVHPAFIVNGSPVDEVLIGTESAVDVDGEMVSQARREPVTSISHDNAITAMRALGPGFCVTTNAMYAALALLMWRDQSYPRGNTDYGRSHKNHDEYGLRPDGDPAIGGNVNGNVRVLAGTGPIEWNFSRSLFGIQGLIGNIGEFSPGVRINDGEINIIKDNDAALSATDMSAGSAEWKAIDYTDGTLIAPGSANAVKYAASGTADGTLVFSTATATPFGAITPFGVSAAALEVLRSLCLIAPDGASGLDLSGNNMHYNLSGERVAFRGGWHASGAAASLFMMHIGDARNKTHGVAGFRPAYVEP